jgi:2-polyprenyl-6-hydroxyphenyl methylase/3-demethylubiquinone-9 3-methyltransferase
MIQILNKSFPRDVFTETELIYLKNFEDNSEFGIEKLWQEMDLVWDNFGLNNKLPFQFQDIGLFYSHPVWILNGIFSSVDKLSLQNRNEISKFINESSELRTIADFGGGFGQLACIISSNGSVDLSIDVIEPYPSKIAYHLLDSYSNIKIKPDLGSTMYDCIIAQDVLEHVENPIKVAQDLTKHLNKDGYIIFANCFYPYIKCHLPANFHLARTFAWIMSSAGLSLHHSLNNAPHIQVFVKQGRVNRVAIICKIWFSVLFYKLVLLKRRII